MKTAQTNALHAEPELMCSLQQLDGTRVNSRSDTVSKSLSEMTQQRADTLLARIAWSRLAEPGDGAAGTLLAALGPERALEMLVQGTRAKNLRAVVQDAGGEMSSKAAAEALKRWLPRLDRRKTVTDIEKACAAGLRVLVPGDLGWPTALNDLDMHSPNMLWVRGNPAVLDTLSLGVVGARAATGYGSHITAEIVDGVCRAGVTIVSGAAYGIDAVAHRTALAAGTPTIAILAGGADRPYPQAHESLLDRISGVGGALGQARADSGEGSDSTALGMSTGAVCSEMVPGSAPTRWRFLQRNRLISALSQATLVTEAGIRSGSLNTAGHAAQLSRPIGAVPGPVTSPASAGCHKLIREYAATLVTNASEACELLGIAENVALFDGLPGEEDRDSAWHTRVLDALPLRGAREANEIARTSGLTTEQAHGVLAELELVGRVEKREDVAGFAPKWALKR